MLDVPSCEGSGWRDLAAALGADHYSAFFATQLSPSEALINLWEARGGGEEDGGVDPLMGLARLLKEIKREDAVVVLERDMRK